MTRFEIIVQFPVGWRPEGPLFRVIVGLRAAGNHEIWLGDRVGSGCRFAKALGVLLGNDGRRREKRTAHLPDTQTPSLINCAPFTPLTQIPQCPYNPLPFPAVFPSLP